METSLSEVKDKLILCLFKLLMDTVHKHCFVYLVMVDIFGLPIPLMMRGFQC
jgi:hypothetical protein